MIDTIAYEREPHPAGAGHHRGDRAHDRDEPGDEDGQHAPALEEAVGAGHVLGPEQLRVRTVEHLRAGAVADPVADQVAEHGGDRRHDQEPRERGVDRADRQRDAGRQQDRVAGQEEPDQQAALGEQDDGQAQRARSCSAACRARGGSRARAACPAPYGLSAGRLEHSAQDRAAQAASSSCSRSAARPGVPADGCQPPSTALLPGPGVGDRLGHRAPPQPGRLGGPRLAPERRRPLVRRGSTAAARSSTARPARRASARP